MDTGRVSYHFVCGVEFLPLGPEYSKRLLIYVHVIRVLANHLGLIS